MAEIVIAAFGTRGDVAPLTGLGRILREAGHEVVLTAPSEYRDLITGCGLRLLPHDIEFDPGEDPVENPRKVAMRFLSPSGQRTIGDALLAVLRDEPADLLMLSPFTELAGHPLAEAKAIPSVGVRLQPLSATASHPPAILGAWSAGAGLNRTAGRLAAATIDRLYGKVVAHFRSALDLPKTPAGALRRRRTRAEWPILHGFSPHVVPRPPDWRPGLDIVGYWWPPRPQTWTPQAELVSFLDAGDPPVLIGFGSLPIPRSAVARLGALIEEAVHTAGVRAVLQPGASGLETTSDRILAIGDAPHDWLLGKVSATVHAAGAGITAATLRAGLPSVTIPEPGGDQPFWARRLHALGATPAPLSRRTLTPAKLATAIGTILTTATHRDAAKQLSARLGQEDPAAATLAVVDRLLH